MSQKNNDLQKIRELIEIMKENDLVEIEIKHGDDKIFLKRGQAKPSISEVPLTGIEALSAGAGLATTGISGELSQITTAQEKENLAEIKSPLVGTFYESPSPDSEPYIEIGSHIDPQTVVCIIEAMKVMNEVKAETGGVITEKLVVNGQAVEYGQVLFRVRPD